MPASNAGANNRFNHLVTLESIHLSMYSLKWALLCAQGVGVYVFELNVCGATTGLIV